MTAAPTIRKLTIERYRTLEHFEWRPGSGVNVLVGGGDVGKTTIIEAVALLFSPTNATLVSDADYYNRDTMQGFTIEAIISLPPDTDINHQKHAAYPWEWDGLEAQVPDPTNPRKDTEPVYRVRVCGSDDLELSYEVVDPDEGVHHFGVAVRRTIGLVRLGGDDRNDRDLRLVQGSALDRLIGDKKLRTKIAQKLGATEGLIDIEHEATERLAKLSTAFAESGLPTDLELGVTGGHGMSVNALIGLTAEKNGVHLPLSSWGSGTRRLASLEIAAANQTDHPIVVVDELERGLEPYRQRLLMSDLLERASQVFVTTHSPIVLAAATEATLWYVDVTGTIGQLSKKQEAHRLRDSEGYLARLAVVVEGDTEIGFVRHLLRTQLPSNLLEHGVVVTCGGGNLPALDILDSLSASGLAVAGFADSEGVKEDCWKRVQARLGPLLHRWPNGCIEQNILPLVPDDELEEFITPPGGTAGARLRTVADRLRVQDNSYAMLAAHPNFRTTIIEAATGNAPDTLSHDVKKQWKSHERAWFKSVDGGDELAVKVLASSAWNSLKPQLMPFVDAIREKAIPKKAADARE
jgi:putative ATP-dependent endonuclease of OLD family